ncbi:MAG: HigA family addiction module antitoxin [Rhodospirillales bacterium]
MTIKRGDLDQGRIDLSDITADGRLAPVHPGAVLSGHFLGPMGLSVYALAAAIKAPRSRINDIVRGRRSLTTDTAFRLARYFGMTPDFWLNLQARYDLDAAQALKKTIDLEVTPRALPPRF